MSLEVDLDLVADAGVHVIGSRQDEDAGLAFAGAPLEDFAALSSGLVVESVEGPVTGLCSAHGFLVVQIEHVFERLVELVGDGFAVAERDEGGCVTDAVLPEYVAFLQEPGLDALRPGHDARAGERVLHVAPEEGGQGIDHGAEQNVDFLLESEHEFAVVATDALDRVAAVHGTAPFAELPPLFFRGVRAEDDVFGLHAEVAQKAHPELVRGPDIEDSRDSDAELRAVLRLGRRCAGSLLSEPGRQR